MDFENKYRLHLKKYTKVGIPRLIEMAEQKKILLYISSLFSMLCALCSLIPYVSIYKILEILLKNYVFYSNRSRNSNDMEKDSQIMIKWGIVSVCSFALVIIFQAISLIFSHIAAYNVLYNIRVRIAEHIGFLPLGYLSNSTTGAISKTLEQNVEKIELFIAHTIPDLVKVAATAVFAFILFLQYNYILTIVCFVVFILALVMQFSGMFSKKSMELQKQYYDICEKISGSIVQFVYGIPVVKIFGKTVFSFRKLADDLNKYREISLECCHIYRTGMCFFIALLESFVAFIIPIGLILLSRDEKKFSYGFRLRFFHCNESRSFKSTFQSLDDDF